MKFILEEDIFALAITKDNSKLISGSHDGSLKVWELKDQKIYQFEKAHEGFPKF